MAWKAWQDIEKNCSWCPYLQVDGGLLERIVQVPGVGRCTGLGVSCPHSGNEHAAEVRSRECLPMTVRGKALGRRVVAFYFSRWNAQDELPVREVAGGSKNFLEPESAGWASLLLVLFHPRPSPEV